MTSVAASSSLPLPFHALLNDNDDDDDDDGDDDDATGDGHGNKKDESGDVVRDDSASVVANSGGGACGDGAASSFGWKLKPASAALSASKSVASARMRHATAGRRADDRCAADKVRSASPLNRIDASAQQL